MYRYWLTDPSPWIMVLVLQIPSFRAIFKYSPYPVLSAFVVILISLATYVLILNHKKVIKKITPLLNSYWITLMAGLIFVALNFLVYPHADALKFVGRGSTADDALIEPAKTFLVGGNLYDAQVPFNVPISPGPGWILLNIPFTATGLYFLMTPFYLCLSVLVFMKLHGEKAGGNLVLLSMSSSLIFWELMVTGHDVISLGCAFVTVLMIIENFTTQARSKKKILSIMGLSILLGTLATSRVFFLIVPPLIALLLWKRDKFIAITLAGTASGVAALFHTFFFVTSESYDPFHLFMRAEDNIGIPLIAAGALITAIATLVVSAKVRNNCKSWLRWFSISLFIPLAFISFGELRKVEYDFVIWEGANYIMPVIPGILFYVFYDYSEKKDL